MIKKEILLGFLIGVFSNSIGILLYVLLFSDLGVVETIEKASQEEFLGTLILLGAIFNFIPFFLFLNKNKPYRARGVIMATIVAALTIAVLKIM